MSSCTFDVRGHPTPKGSTTRMPNGATLPAGTTESRKRMGQWRDDVKQAAMIAMGEKPPMTGPVRLFVEFALMPPRTGIPKYKWGWLPHTKKPDVDKLLRALNDALTGVVWRDDSQVCVCAINKVYAWDGRTGATVDVDEITDVAAQEFAAVSAKVREWGDDGNFT